MKRLLVRVSAFITAAVMTLTMKLEALAATYTDTKGMGNFFEKVYDFIFKKSLDSYFEKHRAEIQVRVKTGIVVVLFVIALAALIIAYFLVTKKREAPDALDEDEPISEEDDWCADDADDED